jgi:hypothetical protein
MLDPLRPRENLNECFTVEVKLSMHLIKYHTMKTRGSGGISPPFLTSVLDGGECSASRPHCFISLRLIYHYLNPLEVNAKDGSVCNVCHFHGDQMQD